MPSSSEPSVAWDLARSLANREPGVSTHRRGASRSPARWSPSQDRAQRAHTVVVAFKVLGIVCQGRGGTGSPGAQEAPSITWLWKTMSQCCKWTGGPRGWGGRLETGRGLPRSDVTACSAFCGHGNHPLCLQVQGFGTCLVGFVDVLWVLSESKG